MDIDINDPSNILLDLTKMLREDNSSEYSKHKQDLQESLSKIARLLETAETIGYINDADSSEFVDNINVARAVLDPSYDLALNDLISRMLECLSPTPDELTELIGFLEEGESEQEEASEARKRYDRKKWFDLKAMNNYLRAKGDL